jgi:hypothetical protein
MHIGVYSQAFICAHHLLIYTVEQERLAALVEETAKVRHFRI